MAKRKQHVIPSTQQRSETEDFEEICSDRHDTYRTVLLEPYSMIPDIFTRPPPVQDLRETDTSEVQNETVKLCLPFMNGSGEVGLHSYNSSGVPRLDRLRHIRFLKTSLETLPGTFVGYDASRPWLLYWCLNGLVLLGEDVSPYRQRLADTAMSMQNATGGFGGGHGQASHLATTYAIVLSLAIAGGEKCYDIIDRHQLWKWLCMLKHPGGGFHMSVGAEVDVRGAYCAAVIISLLNLPLDLSYESPAWATKMPTLFTGLGDYVKRCQTYEGGISAQPGSEAHGGYAFCALGCLSILDSADHSIPRYLHVQRLVAWLSSRQYAPEGGFSGRTNKLVDGCYSHWIGDCWPLVEASLRHSERGMAVQPLQSLFSREGLIRYILCCCQDQTKRGGLRDKPGRMSDPYHTCYVLSGLSSAQHKWNIVVSAAEPTGQAGISKNSVWVVSPLMDDNVQVFEEVDRVNTLHPVYTIPVECVTQMQIYFRSRKQF